MDHGRKIRSSLGPPGLTVGRVGDLTQLVDNLAAETGFAGVVRVDRGGETLIEAAYGLADRAHGIPMTTESQVAIASGSKAFTALVVMSLVEQGALALASTARSVLGADLPLIADEVTVEHLLAHRSGIGDYLDEEADNPIEDYLLTVPLHLLAETEGFLPALDGFATKFPAGQRFEYCNGGFIVLALIAERVAGIGFHQLVLDRVCRPAGMADTDFLRSDALPGRAALHYLQIDGQWRTNVLHLPVRGNGDGGIYTTAADLHRFWPALFAGRIVGLDTLREMTRPRSSTESGRARYGLGFWLDGTGEAVDLEGYDAGVSFNSQHHPGTGLTRTVMATTSAGAAPVRQALDAALAQRITRDYSAR